MEIILLPLAALLTSILSAIIGMGGGILLLTTMFSFMPHSEVIPSHAAVQFASNGTRVLAFLKNVHWGALGRFSIGLFPGVVLGIVLLRELGELGDADPYLKIVVGGYVLLATFLPKPRRREGARASWWGFPALGFIVGAASLTVGAIGPLIAPIFARRDYVKERLIATKATLQLLTHLLKLPAFLIIQPDLPIARLGTVTVLMIAMVIPGTLIGKRILRHVSERHFVVAYRTAMTLAGLKVLLFDGIKPLILP